MDGDSHEKKLDKYITLDGQLASDIVDGIHSKSLHLQLESATKIGQLLRSEKRSAYAAVQAVVDSGLLSNVIDMLSSSDAALASESSTILLHVTLGTPQQRLAAVYAGAIPQLVQVAASTSDGGDVRHNSLVVLGNIAGGSDSLRDIFLKERAFRPALDILADPSKFSPETVNTAAWVMESCSVSHKFSIFSEAIPILSKFISQQNEYKPLAAVVKALRRICSSPKSINMISEAGASPLLVQLCTSNSDDLRGDALFLVSRLAYEGGTPLQSILDNGVLQALQTCITEHVNTRKDAYAVASEIAMATPSAAKILVKSSILSLLIETVADQEEEAEVQLEALTALHNLATKGERKHSFLTSLLKADCVEACCAALRSQDGLRVEKAVRIVACLVDTPWSGADDAIERLEDSDGPTSQGFIMSEYSPPIVKQSVTSAQVIRKRKYAAPKNPWFA
ncbi:Importin alpha subunit (Karyopherin alpha subunit) (Serine-rich RNA polymerase I suppressor protein) [Tulasnella sp. UAMH 9824]|nr:Importin alpha subunit (Karyopherin alpha subunit) (Serine-rich RNA polymerase I suppressor protein) [Tulasnella sp. UAMH 9824]